jgi:hypothetical protein
MRHREVLLSLALLMLIAWALTERWQTWGALGHALVGEILHQIFVDDPQAPLRLTYVTSHLDVSTAVSPIFYRPHRHRAQY